MGFPGDAISKESSCQRKRCSFDWEDPLEKGMATVESNLKNSSNVINDKKYSDHLAKLRKSHL